MNPLRNIVSQLAYGSITGLRIFFRPVLKPARDLALSKSSSIDLLCVHWQQQDTLYCYKARFDGSIIKDLSDGRSKIRVVTEKKMPRPNNVHPFYAFWFTTVDPLTLVPTALGLLLRPSIMIQGLVPATIAPYDPDHGFLFHHLSALYAFLALTLGGVLRASGDIKVWKIVISGVWCIDVAVLASQFHSLEQQGRSALGSWRWQEWGNLAYTGGVMLIRSFFLLGYGSGPTKYNKSK